MNRAGKQGRRLLLFLAATGRSVEPVLESQARHLVEIHGIAREERGVVREGDAGNLQIHRADADALPADFGEPAAQLLFDGGDGQTVVNHR